ncbi:hypothetical protein AWB67_06398 [Caballeronia terrestris]|uniref:Uncharacterized protein n=1 Tax=Caballeronia terrestris TaxID=1226301 RepID=A0A158KQK4_9BURK|nr:hypothetical protein [Caballeronia terrestris]SAL83412.1 hypothetical protein AWB67_06398 [Caballeronia terrestris]
MTIPTIEYRGYDLRAYSHQEFPLHRDPYAKGVRRFSSVGRIDSIHPSNVKPRRYGTVFAETDSANATDAIDLAMQYGKDIVEGKVQAKEL